LEAALPTVRGEDLDRLARMLLRRLGDGGGELFSRTARLAGYGSPVRMV
jgi:hypothetical protein